MYRLFIRHRVRDYASWRPPYDGGPDFRAGRGVIGDDVFTAPGDENDVTVTHDFETREAAERFAESPELADKMRESGVEGEPQVWVAEHRP